MKKNRLIKYILIIVITVFVITNIGGNAFCIEKFKSFITLDYFYFDGNNPKFEEFVRAANAVQNSIMKATNTFEKLGYENVLWKGGYTATDQKRLVMEWIKSKDKERLRYVYVCSRKSRRIHNKIKFGITLYIPKGYRRRLEISVFRFVFMFKNR